MQPALANVFHRLIKRQRSEEPVESLPSQFKAIRKQTQDGSGSGLKYTVEWPITLQESQRVREEAGLHRQDLSGGGRWWEGAGSIAGSFPFTRIVLLACFSLKQHKYCSSISSRQISNSESSVFACLFGVFAAKTIWRQNLP